jgi:hypothetical protein
MSATPGKRPWIAALLGVLVPGLGCVYLRKWWGAVFWYGLVFLTALVTVPESVLASLGSGTVPDLGYFVPVFLVGTLSVVDTYRSALFETYRRDLEAVLDVATGPVCQSCSRRTDSGLSFCYWCGSALQERNSSENEADE